MSGVPLDAQYSAIDDNGTAKTDRWGPKQPLGMGNAFMSPLKHRFQVQ